MLCIALKCLDTNMRVGRIVEEDLESAMIMEDDMDW